MINAILFDMDGVLIDTERLNLKFTIETAKDMGFDVTPEDALTQRSSVSEVSDKFFKSKYGEDFNFYAMRDERRRRIQIYIDENGLELNEGVNEVLDHVEKRNLKKAVVTSSDFDRAMVYIRMLGIEDRFDTIVSASMVELGKPNPDVYLYTAEIIGENPEDCIAVEDSPNGVRSAYSAGCKVAMYPDLTEPDEEMREMSSWVLDSIKDLIKIVDESLNKR